eukprot:symbB.v1.2.030276.t1/scaffold3393.1/size57804/2
MAFMPWPLRGHSSHLAFPSRALRPEPRVPRASCPTPRRRGAGLVALLSVAAPRATARQPKFPEAVEVEVSLTPELNVKVLEASLDWQETLIEEAVEQEDEFAVEADPYGMAVWPAGQVLAQAAAGYALEAKKEKKSITALELGCGCGLASLAVLALEGSVIATDFRPLPLQLLTEAATRQRVEKRLKVQQFDLRDVSNTRLPEADVVMASDVLYERHTAKAMAYRIHEALERGSAVLIADIGRPNRKVFLSTLSSLRPEEDFDFRCSGLAVHSGAGSQNATSVSTNVELLELPRKGPGERALSLPPLVQKWLAPLRHHDLFSKSTKYGKELFMLRHVISTNGGIQQVLGALDLSGKDLVRSGLWAKFAGGPKSSKLCATARGTSGVGEILEIGTYCAYSAVSLAAEGAKVTTIEMDPVLVGISRCVIAHAGVAPNVRVLTGHSRLVLPRLQRSQSDGYDLIFMDRWGSQYPEDLHLIEDLGLLKSRGVLVADNVLRTVAAEFLWRIFKVSEVADEEDEEPWFVGWLRLESWEPKGGGLKRPY